MFANTAKRFNKNTGNGKYYREAFCSKPLSFSCSNRGIILLPVRSDSRWREWCKSVPRRSMYFFEIR